MLTNWLDTLLTILSQFMGTETSIGPVLINYVIKATFYLYLFLFLRIRFNIYSKQHEQILMWGFGFGLTTQLLGLCIALTNSLGWINPAIHTAHLLINDTLHNILLITIAASYIKKYCYDEKQWLTFVKAGLSVTLFIFIAANWQWFTQIAAEPASTFDPIAFGWPFHANAGIWLGLVIVLVVVKRLHNLPTLILIALTLLFNNELMQVLAYIYPKQQSALTSLSKLSYFFALALLAYIYLKECVAERLTHNSALTQSEAKLNAMLKTINDPIWLKDPHGAFIACNAEFERFYNVKEAMLIGKTDHDFTDKETANFYRKMDLIAIEKGAANVNEEWVTFADNGQRVLLETTKTPMFDQTGSLIGVLGIAHDITERKKIESQTKQYELIVNSSSEAIISKTISGVVTSWNSGAEKVFGYTADEMIGKPALALIPKGLEREESQIQKRLLNGEHIHAFDTIRLHQSGRAIHISTTISPIYDDKGQLIGTSEIASDNTEHIIADQKFKRLSGLYKALSEINQAIIRMEHEEELFPLVCRCAVDYGNLSMAWIGVLDPKDSQIKPTAVYGEHNKYLDGITISADASRIEGRGPAGRTMRENRLIVSNDISKDNTLLPWKERMIGSGWNAACTSPINRGGRPFAVLCVYHTQTHAFDQEIVALLRSVSSDITFALDNFDREIQRQSDADSLRLAASVYTASKEAMVVSNPNHEIIDINPAFTEITGYSKSEIIGQSTKILMSPKEDKANIKRAQEQVILHGIWDGETWARNRYGKDFPIWITISSIYNDDASLKYHIALLTDITKKKSAEELIWTQANLDPLTSLPNRYMFNDRLDQEIKRSDRSGLPLALLFLDLDRFKEVNDSLGHTWGDDLLKVTADRLKKCTRESDTVARLGGDEFTIILGNLDDISKVYRVLESILNSVAQPFQLNNNSAYVTASIGVTFYPSDATSAEELIRNADQAMYAAKSAGRNQVSLFTEKMQRAVEARTRLATELHQALAKKQIWVAYQPILELNTGRIIKAEALVRWKHPELGDVSPAEFIPVAEDTGLIIDIGDWVFKQALEQVKVCQQFEPNFQISVNKSPIQIHKVDDQIESWHQQLKKADLSRNSIVVEITEGLLLENNAFVNDKLLEFRDAGIQVALDDFGTGYSSLSYLQKFDIDYIKIDQSFVRNLGVTHASNALCEAIIVMAHKLGMQVIAEGIETEVQLDILKNIGCDFGQGYFFSKPVSPTAFNKLLAKN